MAPQDGLENRRSGNVTVGSNPTLSAVFCGFPDKDDVAQDAPFTPRSTSSDGTEAVARWEWLYCPTGFGEMRFHKERFEAMLARCGIHAGTPPKLPNWCVEPPEKLFRGSVKRGVDAWTYFARGKYSGRIKIGMSKDPNYRVTQLPYCRFGEAADLIATVRGDHFEKVYHNVFSEWHEGHEWFAPHPDILAEIDRLNEEKARA